MSLSLAERAGLAIPAPVLRHEPIEHSSGVLPRLIALASFAHQLDPSVPTSLRAYRHVPEGVEPRDIRFKIAFTRDTQSRLPNGVIEDEGAEEFWEVMKRVLPQGMAAHEKSKLEATANALGKPAFDVAVEEGFRTMRFNLYPHQRSPAEGHHFYTSPIAVSEEAFMEFPDLANQAFLTPSAPNMETATGRLIARFQAVRATLAKPFEGVSLSERQAVGQHIQALNDSQLEGTFEENHRHGWVAYALGHGGRGWTKHLINQVNVSPHVPYGKLGPLTLAVGSNDRLATLDLLEAGVSPNTVLREWPRMFHGKPQETLSGYQSDYLPVTVLGAAVGSTAAVGALLEHGAEVNYGTEKNDTALHLACAHGFEAMIRLLKQHGADFTAKNEAGFVPDELVPQGPLYDSIHRFAQQAHDQQQAQGGLVEELPNASLPRTLGERAQEVIPTETLEQPWAEAPRPGPTRRTKHNP